MLLAAVAASTIVLSAHDAGADAIAGLRLGITDDPDTIYGGVQFQSVLSRGRSARIYFVPAIDFGVGDHDFWLVRGTGHFEFHFPLGRDRSVSIFPLLGFEIDYYNWDLPEPADDDDVEAGLDVGGGFMWDRFKLSVWAGVRDVPDITIAFGVFF